MLYEKVRFGMAENVISVWHYWPPSPNEFNESEREGCASAGKPPMLA
jgi:hypothetical protein